MNAKWVILVGGLCAGSLLHGQGFANLNFEQASIVSAASGYTPWDAFNAISATNALPHWTVMENGTVCTSIWGDPYALDETSVALVSEGGYSSPIQGNYSVQLSAYADASSPFYTNSAISQTGLIPNGTLSIEFQISSPSQAGAIQPDPIVTLNGIPISLSEISQSGGIITMAGDVSAFAGTTANLTFLCQATPGATFAGNENIFNLDNIQFSANPAPEPRTLALAALGGVLLGCRSLKKTKIKTAVALTLQAGLLSCFSQGFINLNFEHPSLPLNPSFNFVSTANAIPGWTAYYATTTGTNQTDSIGYNTISGGGALVILEDTNSIGYTPLQGTYSVVLGGSFADTPTAAAIGQTGTISVNSQSMVFDMSVVAGTLLVSFNGQPLNYAQTGSTTTYGIYTADISAYAGQTGQLLFTTPSGTAAMIDNIQFSTSAVPEPHTLALAALGGVLFGCRRFQKVK